MHVGSSRLQRVHGAIILINADMDFHALGEAFRAAAAELLARDEP